MTQREVISPTNMAGEEIVDEAPLDVHDDMEFRLGDIELQNLFSDLHPSLARIDRLRREWKFQFKLLFREWTGSHWIALATGISAFLLGSISGELFGGGDSKVVGLDGISQVSGFGFFQMVVSGLLWLWFGVQIAVLFPIMRSNMFNIIIVWLTAFLAQLFLHVPNPNFPSGASMGDMPGGIVLTAVSVFFTYFFWKAVSETRDMHVQEHHVHTDVRVMERAMEEHSLYAWSTMVILWVVILIINGWSGAHFVADRNADKIGILIIHIITGFMAIAMLMQIFWFPQRMLGTGTQVRTKAAAYADAELLDTGLSFAAEGVCPSCEAPAPINRNDVGDIIVDCGSKECNRRGPAGKQCEGCDEKFPTRLACPSCGLNSPVGDYLPDSEAW